MRDSDIDDPSPGHQAVDGWFRAVSVAVVLGTLAYLSTGPARRNFDAAVRTVFPSRVTLQVTPGNSQVEWGSLLAIQARLVGAQAREAAEVEWGDGNHWQTTDMATDGDGQFYFRFDSVTTAFHYRIVAGTLASRTYAVSIAAPSAPGFRN